MNEGQWGFGLNNPEPKKPNEESAFQDEAPRRENVREQYMEGIERLEHLSEGELLSWNESRNGFYKAGLSKKESFFLLWENSRARDTLIDGKASSENIPEDEYPDYRRARIFARFLDEEVGEKRDELIERWGAEIESMTPEERQAATEVITAKRAVKQALTQYDKSLALYNQARFKSLTSEDQNRIKSDLEDDELTALLDTGSRQYPIGLDQKVGRPNFFWRESVGDSEPNIPGGEVIYQPNQDNSAVLPPME